MHKYLSAVGFSEISKKGLELLLAETADMPDKMTVAKDSEGNEFVEYLMTVTAGNTLGIAVRGNYDEDEKFVPEYYVPYFEGSIKTTEEIVEIEKHIEKESYAGLCDDPRLGLTLIFSINDSVEYLARKKVAGSSEKVKGAYLSALSTEAKVLLPIRQEHVVKNYIDEKKRQVLQAEAAQGSEDAMENLSLQDMNLYSIITRRIQKEDMLTIVSSYFMPYGIESDLYGILGEIKDLREVVNEITEEHLYIMQIECNGLNFDLCINKKQLMGIPAVGMRIKASIWLLGTVCQ